MGRTRWLVSTTVGALLLSVAAGCGSGSDGSSTTASSNSKCKELRLITWEGYVEPKWTAPFEKAHGVKIKPTFTGSEDETLAKMVAGGDRAYDIISTSSPASQSLIDLGVLKELDPAKLPGYNGTIPFTRTSFVKDGKNYAAPYDWDVNPFLYYSNGVAQQPTSWSDLWKPEFQNKFAIWDDMGSLYIGASALGYATSNDALTHLSDEQLAAIKAKMLQLKPRTVWSQGGQVADLLANREVIASAPGWTYTYNELRRRDPRATKDLRAVVFPNHGGFAWSEGYGISKKIPAECVDTAYAWLNWMQNPKTQAEFATFVGYSPAVLAARKYLDAKTRQALHMNNPKAWYSTALIKGDPGPLRQKYVQTWQEIKQGLQ